MRGDAFSPGLRRAAIALWLTGVGLAATTGALAVARGKVGYGFLYAVVAAALGFLAAATRTGRPWAELVTLFLLGSQVIGTAGAAWELAFGADGTAKARHLHDLGISYRWALVANLAFSALASCVFTWAVSRVVQGRRRRH